MEAANTVFEHHDEQADYDAIEDLAGDFARRGRTT